MLDIRPQGAYGKRIRKIFAGKEVQKFEQYVLQNFHNNPWLAKPADQQVDIRVA
ncbi:hypothetical protein ACLB1N_35310 [Escherichia coli]